MKKYKYLNVVPCRPGLNTGQNNNKNTLRQSVLRANDIVLGITKLFFSSEQHRRSPENCWNIREDFGWDEEDTDSRTKAYQQPK